MRLEAERLQALMADLRAELALTERAGDIRGAAAELRNRVVNGVPGGGLPVLRLSRHGGARVGHLLGELLDGLVDALAQATQAARGQPRERQHPRESEPLGEVSRVG
jgi:hypothetical protein